MQVAAIRFLAMIFESIAIFVSKQDTNKILAIVHIVQVTA